MKYVIKLILFAICMLLFGALSYGQNASPILGSGTSLQINYNKGGGADDSMTAIPVRRGYVRSGDTLYKNYRMKGRIRVDYDSSRLYYHDGMQDVRVLDVKDTLSLVATKNNIRNIDTSSLSNRIDTKMPYADTATMLLPYARQSRNIGTAGPLNGGGDLSANRTISIANASADGTTKGAASFTAGDFNSASGNISLDYTNGQAATSTLNGFLSATDWTIFNNKVAATRTLNTTYPLQGGGDLSANRTLALDTANWHGYNFYKTQFHQQGGNSYGTSMTQGTLDANGWSVFTNGPGNTRYSISGTGAHAFTGTTFDFTPTTGAVSISNGGQLTVTRGGTSENSLSVGLSGSTPRVIMGIGNGTVASSGRPFVCLSQSGIPDASSTAITSAGGNLLFTNINGNGQVNYTSNNQSILTPIFTVSTNQTPIIRWAPAALFNGGGITASQDFFNVYFNNNANANITYTSGTSTFRTCLATPRINTSGTHTGNIEGFVYEPNEVAVAAGTVQVGFRANNTSGYGVFIGNAAVKNHFNGHVLVGTTTDDANAILKVNSTVAYALLPRMTTTQRDAITPLAEGAEIYNLTTHKKQVYDGTAWQDCW